MADQGDDRGDYLSDDECWRCGGSGDVVAIDDYSCRIFRCEDCGAEWL